MFQLILAFTKFDMVLSCLGGTFLLWASAGALEVFNNKKPFSAIVILGILGAVSFVSAFYFMSK